jgi:diaminohydroxyphosphoribosylaminopyrimidine deaminase/5-amino-6-(5-phosphoribosylamino)uracil reductase
MLPLPPDPSRPRAPDPDALIAELGRRHSSNVLVEGGSEVLGAFFDRDLIDRTLVFIAPLVVGGREAVTALAGEGTEVMEEVAGLVGTARRAAGGEVAPHPASPRVRRVGDDVLLEGWVHDPIQWSP